MSYSELPSEADPPSDETPGELDPPTDGEQDPVTPSPSPPAQAVLPLPVLPPTDESVEVCMRNPRKRLRIFARVGAACMMFLSVIIK